MKKTLLIIVQFFFVLHLSAQNWNLFNKDYAYNYALSNSTIELEVKTDSIKTINGETIFYFNRIVYSCDTCSDFRNGYFNSPHVFDYQCSETDTTYIFTPFKNYIFYRNAAVGKSWVFNEKLNITATVVSKSTADILGQLDSVMVVGLSNNDSIIVSKQFGILSIRDPHTNIKHELIGVRTSNEIFGQTAPDWTRIYDFEVGDVFCYEETSSCYCDVSPSTRITKSKMTILSQQIKIDSLVYEVSVEKQTCSEHMSIPNNDTAYILENDTIVIAKEEVEQWLRNNYETFPANPDIDLLSFTTHFVDTDGVYTVQLGGDERDEYLDNNYLNRGMANGSTVFQPYPVSKYRGVIWQKIFKEGLGEVSYTYEYGELSYTRKLVAYKNSNCSFGKLFTTKDLNIALDVEKNKLAKTKVFPSLTNSRVYVTLNPESKYLIELYNFSGVKVLSRNLTSTSHTSFDISSFQAGMYFIKVTSGTDNNTYRVIKK